MKRRFSCDDYANNTKQFIEDYERLVGDNFFSKDRLKFFGERKSEMRILLQEPNQYYTDEDGNSITVPLLVLSVLQRNHPNGKQRVYYYFNANTLQRVIRRR